MDWTDGYVSDIAYTGGVFREQMPAHLDAACLVAGIAPPVPPGAPFTYCELGCGLGDSAMAVAAAYGNARVWGFDFNPTHIARARQVAERIGIDNITFAEVSFEELATAAPADLPSFDYVTLHGVWSWISPANRAHIVTFLRRHLRAGGLASVSYNALPGWGARIPIQHLLYEASRTVTGSSERRFREGIEIVRRVAGNEESIIEQETLTGIEKLLEEGRIRYLSHEYLNEHWSPCYFSDVSAALQPAKLSYAASANLLENFLSLCIRPEQRAIVESLPPALWQTVQDYCCPRTFRRDIFVRGPQTLPEPARQARLLAQRLLLLDPPGKVERTIDAPVGRATLNEPFYAPALASLERGPARIGDLLRAAEPGTAPVPEEVFGMLLGGRKVLSLPFAPDAAALERVRAYNRNWVELALENGEKTCTIVGAAAGVALPADLIGMLLYLILSRSDAPREPAPIDTLVAAFHALLHERGVVVRPSDPDVPFDIEAEIGKVMREQVPLLIHAGAL